MTKGRVIRTALVAAIAIGLCAYSVAFAYRAGCAENAAGMTIESIDHSAYSAWLFILALPIGGALVATRPSVNGMKALRQAIGFMLISAPVGVVMLHYIEENGAKDCNWLQHAAETSATQNIQVTALMQWPSAHRKGKLSVTPSPSPSLPSLTYWSRGQLCFA